MVQTGQLRLLQETEESRVSGWFSWGISVVSRPIKWFWRGYLSPSNPALGNNVFVDTQLLQVRVIKIDFFPPTSAGMHVCRNWQTQFFNGCSPE